MTDPKDIEHARATAFDRDEGKFGQGYSLDEERRLGRAMPAGSVAAKPSQVAPGEDGTMPPDNGRRASFDPATGEVHGSGAGAGGGNAGEDFDDDAPGEGHAP